MDVGLGLELCMGTKMVKDDTNDCEINPTKESFLKIVLLCMSRESIIIGRKYLNHY